MIPESAYSISLKKRQEESVSMPTTKEIFQKINEVLAADPSRTGGLQAVYQFNISGDDAGVYQIILNPDSAQAVEGQPEIPNCTLEMDSNDFKDMLEGKLNGTAAFMSGKLRVNGDLGLAMRLESILSAYSA
jgi:putative sterol carrier protein